jgi:hypothetical protein
VDPNLRSTCQLDEDNGTYDGADQSPLLLAVKTAGNNTEQYIHQPIWTKEETATHDIQIKEAKAVLAKKANLVPAAERKAAQDTLTWIGEDGINDYYGSLTKIDLLIKHPLFDPFNCNHQGVLDSWIIEQDLRYIHVIIFILIVMFYAHQFPSLIALLFDD